MIHTASGKFRQRLAELHPRRLGGCVLGALVVLACCTTAAWGQQVPPVSVTQKLQEAWERNQTSFASQTGQFLSLAAQGVGIALLIGIPLGVALTRVRRFATPSLSVLAVVQTIPSLALLGLLIPLVGIGRPPTLIATVLYSLLPVVMNTYVGIVQVSPSIRDAARGMGMTNLQILYNVELPLALPTLLAGIRTGVVYAMGVITVCALAGAGGLGDYIARGLSRGDHGLVLLGALPILALTLAAFWGLGLVAKLAEKNPKIGLASGGILSLALAGFAAWETFRPASADTDLVIGSKNFTENVILAEIMRQMIESHTDLRCQTRYGLGSNLAYLSLKSGDLQLYPEYTGTLLTAVDALNRDIPEDKSSITKLVREEMRQNFDMVLLPEFGLNNTYAIAVSQDTAREYNLRTIGDLARAPRLKIVVSDEFLDRPDGWPGLAETYGLEELPLPTTMTPELMYEAMRSGQAEVCSGFATDWQIEAYDLFVLEDDREYFPSYHAAPLVAGSALERFPQIRDALAPLAGKIDDNIIRQLNRRVAQERQQERQVAREFLQRLELLPSTRE